MLDLILRGGRVIDPLNSIDGVMDVGFAARGQSSPPVSSTCIRTYIGAGHP